MVNYAKLYNVAKKTFEPVEYLNYQSAIRTPKSDKGDEEDRLIIHELEEQWWQTNAQPIADFMGDMTLWNNVLPENLDIAKGHERKMKKNDKFMARYTGQHWVSRKPDEEDWFNAFEHYQIKDTNQFCQTYAMMHLLDKLPPRQDDNKFSRYYDYTLAALKFVKNDIISSFYKDAHYFDTSKSDHEHTYYSQKDMLNKVNNCIKYYEMCLNIPAFNCELHPTGPI